MWWGYTEALDVQKEFQEARKKTINETPKPEELNVLLYGASDARHILKTLSKSYEHPKRKINFFVVEPTLELYARHMLLLSVALEPADKLGLLEKTRLFMEIYGNSLIRPTTTDYISKKSAQLIVVVTTLDHDKIIFQLDQLKYKERDGLETILKFWSKPHAVNFTQMWDLRLRKSLGIRYDARGGVFDWDYHMNLLPTPGYDTVNKGEYKNWRATGVAFTWLETQYSKGNPTLMSGITKLQDTAIHYGYYWDMVTGPYAGFGLDCEDKEMLKKRQDMYVKRATDIAERNVMRMLHETQSGTKYVHKATEDEMSAGIVITEIAEHVEETEIMEKKVERARKTEGLQLMETDVSVTFLPLKCFKGPQVLSPKYESFFDVVWIAQYLDKHINDDLIGLGRDAALLLVENKKLLVELKAKDLEEHGKVLEDRVKDLKVERVGEFDPVKDTVAKFMVCKGVSVTV